MGELTDNLSRRLDQENNICISYSTLSPQVSWTTQFVNLTLTAPLLKEPKVPAKQFAKRTLCIHMLDIHKIIHYLLQAFQPE